MRRSASPTISIGRFSSPPRAVYPDCPPCSGSIRTPTLLWIYLVFALGLALFLLSPRPLVRWIASALLALPFLLTFAALFLQSDSSDRVEAFLRLWPVLLIASLGFALWSFPRAATIAQLLPLILLGAIHGAFLSQQLWGSTYALWPLLIILIATLLVGLAQANPRTKLLGKDSAVRLANGIRNSPPCRLPPSRPSPRSSCSSPAATTLSAMSASTTPISPETPSNTPA